MAHQQLASALRGCAEQVAQLRDVLDLGGAHFGTEVLDNAHTLVNTLAAVAGGMPLLQAMGRPGDWGRSTPIGAALVAALNAPAANSPQAEARGLSDEELYAEFAKLYPKDSAALNFAENNRDYAEVAISPRRHWSAFKHGGRAALVKFCQVNGIKGMRHEQ